MQIAKLLQIMETVPSQLWHTLMFVNTVCALVDGESDVTDV